MNKYLALLGSFWLFTGSIPIGLAQTLAYNKAHGVEILQIEPGRVASIDARLISLI